jgi:hypothetical protein
VTGTTVRRRATLLSWGRMVWALFVVLSCSSCATLTERGRTLVPTRHQVRTGPFIVFSNVPIAEDAPAIRCLEALQRDLKQHLDYHPRPEESPVEIYVLDDRNAFTHFLKFYFPELPPRRAFFLAQGPHRVVYTYSSPRLEEDLRHEATHALVRGSFGDLPLWLDEGLSEYFEVDLASLEGDRERTNHFAEDLAQGWSPDLRRLESLTDIRQMTPRDYREAWAWIHLFLDDQKRGKAQLVRCLAEFGAKADKLKLAQDLVAAGADNDRLLAHVKDCQSRLLTAEPSMADRAVRMQDRLDEAPAVRDHPPGLLQRIRAWIGL